MARQPYTIQEIVPALPGYFARMEVAEEEDAVWYEPIVCWVLVEQDGLQHIGGWTVLDDKNQPSRFVEEVDEFTGYVTDAEMKKQMNAIR